MERLLARLRRISRAARRNRDEIDELITDVQSLDISRTEAETLSVPGAFPASLGSSSSGSSLEARNRDQETENDATIARLLSEELESHRGEARAEETARAVSFPGHADDYLDDESSNERLETAIALAIADSLDELHLRPSTDSGTATRPEASSSWLPQLQAIAAGSASAPPECSVCLFSLQDEPEHDDEDENEDDGDSETWERAPAGVFTTACAHTFHTTCLRRWFRENKICPICRLDVEEEFVQEVMGS